MRTVLVLAVLCGAIRAEEQIEKPPAPPDNTLETSDDDVRAAIRAAKAKPAKTESPAVNDSKEARKLIDHTSSQLKSAQSQIEDLERKVSEAQAELESAKADLNRAHASISGATDIDAHLYRQQANKAARRVETASDHLASAKDQLATKKKALNAAMFKAAVVMDHFSDYFEANNPDHQCGALKTFKVVQIYSENEMMIHLRGQDVWIEGVSTTGYVDGSTYESDVVVKANGTKRYTTVLGASRTVYAAMAAATDK